MMRPTLAPERKGIYRYHRVDRHSVEEGPRKVIPLACKINALVLWHRLGICASQEDAKAPRLAGGHPPPQQRTAARYAP